MHGKNISDSRHSLKKKSMEWGQVLGMVNSSVLLQHRVLGVTSWEVENQVGARKRPWTPVWGVRFVIIGHAPPEVFWAPLQLLDLMGTFPGPLSLEMSHCSSIRFTVSSGFSEPLSSTQLLMFASGFKALKTVWIWSKLFQKGFDILPLVLYTTGKRHWCFRLGSKQCCLFSPQGRRIRHSVFLSFMFSS